MTLRRVAINIVAFQTAWLAIVAGGARGENGLVAATVALAVLLHLVLSAAPLRELVTSATVGAVGVAWDSVPVAAGWIEYRGCAPINAAPPYWIAALWLVFATTLNVSLRWMRGRARAAAALGAVAGPLCYLAGEAMGALRFVDRPIGLAAEAAAWCVLLPGSVALASWIERGRARV